MITTSNEFETVPAFETLAGSSLGTWSNRAIAYELVSILEKVSQFDCLDFYKTIAACEDDSDILIIIQEDIVEKLNEYMPMPEFCTVTLQDGEWIVIPYIDDDLKRVADIPEAYTDDYVLFVNDHGNVTCYQWNDTKREYVSIWDMV
jgi:hypothetical protein